MGNVRLEISSDILESSAHPPGGAIGAGLCFDPQDSLPACLARIAKAHPLRTALATAIGQVTYAELNAHANSLAQVLLRRGGVHGDRVAILMAHDAPQIAAMIAVFKAGRIAVILNPAEPQGRLAQYVKDSGAALILTDEARWNLACDLAGKDSAIMASVGAEDGDEAPGIAISSDDVAVLSYTSGSTGIPKAVMQTHGQILATAAAQSRVMGLAPEDRVALLASIGGSQGLTTAWCALTSGASLWPYPVAEKGVAELARWINDNGITVYISAPSLFRHFMRSLDGDAIFQHVHVVKLGAEMATRGDFAKFQAHFSDRCVLINTLGCTEVGNIAAMRFSRSDEVADGPLPVGHVHDSIEVLLLDENGMQLGPGEMGEVVVRGRYLAAGYWQNEALTAQRFSQDPRGNGVRLFRSGDLGRFDERGFLQLRGRKDSLVKIRGHRVEPSEVEGALLKLPGIERAVAYGIDGSSPHALRLAASIEFRPGQKRSAAALRRELRVVLPNYMVPSSFAFLDAFPLGSNGKIDRHHLRRNHPLLREGTAPMPAETETEALIAGIWAEAFYLAAIGRQDDFFDLGGDSLIAAVIAARVHNALHVDLHLGMFTEHPALSGFAAAIDNVRRRQPREIAPVLTRVPRDVVLPLSFAQERIWKYSNDPGSSAGYTMASSYRITGALDPGVLQDCMNAMARRHEILRTNFATIESKPAPVIHPPAPIFLAVHDFRGPGAEEKASALFKREAAHVFDLAKGPLLRFLLVRIRDSEHWLLRVSHHILSDAGSWNIYFQELALLYEAKIQGHEPSLAEAQPLQYADFAVWERQTVLPEMPAYGPSVQWWKRQFTHLPRCLELPLKRTKPVTGLDPEDGVIAFGLDPEISQGLDELKRKSGTTFFMSRLAIFALLIAADANEPDVVLGTYATQRKKIQTQSMIGFFSNPVALRLPCHPQTSFRDWLATVRDVVVQTASHSQIPYEELRARLSADRAPIPDITVFFAVLQEPVSERFAGLDLKSMGQPRGHMPWGFAFECNEHDEQQGCRITFNAGIYEPLRVRAFIERYRRLATTVSRHPELPLHRLVVASGIATARPADTP